MLNVLVQRILLVVDGGDGASGGAIRLLEAHSIWFGQFAPGILAIVHGDYAFQGMSRLRARISCGSMSEMRLTLKG